jgi:hypothetical protein
VEGHEAEVLRGLSQPLPWTAFEYLPAALDVAMACLDRLDALGPHRYNLVRGEACAFALPEWRPASAFRAALAEVARDGRSGDVYARLDRPADDEVPGRDARVPSFTKVEIR